MDMTSLYFALLNDKGYDLNAARHSLFHNKGALLELSRHPNAAIGVSS